jgi:NADH:ubiquinone oxidoreductase subunit F (NADH-binding)
MRHASATELPRLLSTIGHPGLAAHQEHWGRRPGGDFRLTAEIGRVGLGGRGGAGFPTAVKWAAVAQAGHRSSVVVANATEGEPASNKDKTLLQHAPHLVLDGLVLAAETLGAVEAIVCVEEGAGPAIRSLTRALAERVVADEGSVPVRIEVTPPGYVTGEESSLVSWLNRGKAKPTFGPRPYEKGIGGRPTLINNVETLANVALIARFGESWYRRLGTPESPGTALVTVAGDVDESTVFEIAMGTPLARVIDAAGPVGRPVAALVGGYSGTWLGAEALAGATVDGPSLRRVGAALGCGSILVVSERSCPLRAAAVITGWLAGQSAGQCGPCVHGLPAVAGAMERLVAGENSKRWNTQLGRWLSMVEGRGACKHPDGAARMVRSAMSVLGDEIARHARGVCRLPPPALALPAAGGH